MTCPDITACAFWLQQRVGAYVFTVDHPGLPQCAGAHRPGQPCDGTRGKHPCGRWSRDSTNSPAVIGAQLARGLRNIGIDMGRSGMFAVDEDRPGAFAEYAASLGETIPSTFTVATSKGRHFYFRQPADRLGNGRGALKGLGIDIRGAGGFVLGPGSIHETGVVYTPDDSSVPVAAAPDWLVAALRTPPRPGSPPDPASPESEGPLYVRLRGIVAAVVDAKEGERNNTLYWASCRLAGLVRGGQIEQAAAEDMLTSAGEAAGLGSSEVEATVASGLGLVSA
jgi:Bifunctional DNA primase/polymerase, N-terminal